jgi:hypothetical protein
MDIGDTVAPKSEQLDAIDLDGNGRVFTITGAKIVDGDQPVHISLAEFDRVWKPSKNVRRVLIAAWGDKSSAYVGKRVRLVRDPEVRWAGKNVGGVRIAAMSDIPDLLIVGQMDGHNATTITIPLLTESAPKSKPAPATPTDPTPEQIAASVDRDELRRWWTSASTHARKVLIEARVAELAPSAPEPTDGTLGEGGW